MIQLEESLKTIAGNLQFVAQQRSGITPLEKGQMAEIAAVMAKAIEDADDREELRRVWHETLGIVGDFADRVELAKSYHAALKKPKTKEDVLAPIGSICYLRNRGSDGAFDHFTANLHNVRVSYAAGHEEALENCYDEYSDACILPYSDPERGLHTGFRTLIARYGLKISDMVRVESREGTALDYVLLRREIELPKKDSYMAVTIALADGRMLAEPLLAASSCQLTKGSVIKLPDVLSTADSYDLHFFGSPEAIEQYLFYLALTHPRYDLLGIYQKEREMI